MVSTILKNKHIAHKKNASVCVIDNVYLLKFKKKKRKKFIGHLF